MVNPGMAENLTDPAARLPKFRRQTPDQRRRALIEATIHCLGERGVEHSSIRNICEEAGVSIGLVNHYYSGKEALVADAYQQVADDLLARLQDEVDAAGEGARARLSAFFRGSFSSFNLDPGLLRVWMAFWQLSQQSAVIAEVHARTYRAYRETLEELLGELADEHGFDRGAVPLAAIGLSGLLDGLWLELCLNPATCSADDGLRLCETWLEGLIATGMRLGKRGTG